MSEGSESAFVGLMDRHTPGLMQLAQYLVPDEQTATAVVEQTWLALLSELGRFDGAAPLKVWLHGRLLQVIRMRHPEIARALDESAEAECSEPVAAERFSPPGDRWQGHWATPPKAWSTSQVAALPAVIASALRALPPIQRAIAVLHDCEGISVPLVSQLLSIEESRCRQLLHVARARLWAANESYLAARETA